MKKKLSRQLSVNNFEKLETALNQFNPSLLETTPPSPKDIYKYYVCIDNLYIWLKNSYNDDLCVLCNEIRAILGHLSEYNIDDEDKKRNLNKAYGHLRRLSIDSLKILCNGLDQVFDEWIQKHVRYDYSNKDNSFLPQYIEKYYSAHYAYLQVQMDENLGSDQNNKIIEKYHNAAKEYLSLYAFHKSKRRLKIERASRVFNLNKIAYIIALIIITVISVIGEFFIK